MLSKEINFDITANSEKTFQQILINLFNQLSFEEKKGLELTSYRQLVLVGYKALGSNFRIYLNSQGAGLDETLTDYNCLITAYVFDGFFVTSENKVSEAIAAVSQRALSNKQAENTKGSSTSLASLGLYSSSGESLAEKEEPKDHRLTGRLSQNSSFG